MSPLYLKHHTHTATVAVLGFMWTPGSSKMNHTKSTIRGKKGMWDFFFSLIDWFCNQRHTNWPKCSFGLDATELVSNPMHISGHDRMYRGVMVSQCVKQHPIGLTHSMPSQILSALVLYNDAHVHVTHTHTHTHICSCTQIDIHCYTRCHFYRPTHIPNQPNELITFTASMFLHMGR